MTKIQSRTALVSSAMLFVSGAHAGVTEFQVAKVHIYEQTTSSAPTSPDVFLFNPYVDMLQGDAASATINADPLDELFPGGFELTLEFSTQAALDGAYPNFVFDFHIEGGALGTRDETITFSSPPLYPAPASLTPASFDATQNADPSQDLLIEWNTPDASTNFLYLEITSADTDTDIFSDELPVSQTSLLIPARTLNSDELYEIEISFGNANIFPGQPAPGFGTDAQGISGYAASTLISFTTAVSNPCQADFNNDGSLDFFDVSAFLNAFSAGCP